MIGRPNPGLSTLLKYTLKPFHPKYNKGRLWVAQGCILSALVMSTWKKPLHCPAAMLGLFISCMSLRTHGVVVIVSEDWVYWQWNRDLCFNCCSLGCCCCWIDYFLSILFDTCHYVNPTYVPSGIKIYSPPGSRGLKHSQVQLVRRWECEFYGCPGACTAWGENCMYSSRGRRSLFSTPATYSNTIVSLLRTKN